MFLLNYWWYARLKIVCLWFVIEHLILLLMIIFLFLLDDLIFQLLNPSWTPKIHIYFLKNADFFFTSHIFDYKKTGEINDMRSWDIELFIPILKPFLIIP